MMVHPYVQGGELDRQAIDAANQRTVYYGTLGLMDPRTYTLDVYMIRKVAKQPWAVTLRMSAEAAAIGAATSGLFGHYSPVDPFEVTPEYSQLPEEYDPFGIDMRSLHM